MRRLLAGLLILALAGCCGGSCGSCGPWICIESCCFCRRLDEWHAGIAARRCALESLAAQGSCSCDYSRGFVQAYVDLAHGATGQVPPVPPQRYWSVCFRTCPGHDRADQWFAGYQAGVASANGGLGAPCQTIAGSGTYYDPGPGQGNATLPGDGVTPAAQWSTGPVGPGQPGWRY